MSTYRIFTTAFKREVAQEFLAGASLNAFGRKHGRAAREKRAPSERAFRLCLKLRDGGNEEGIGIRKRRTGSPPSGS